MVFKAIFDKMGDVKTEEELEKTITQINTSMDNILSESTQYFAPFIGCILVSMTRILQVPYYIHPEYLHKNHEQTV